MPVTVNSTEPLTRRGTTKMIASSEPVVVQPSALNEPPSTCPVEEPVSGSSRDHA